MPVKSMHNLTVIEHLRYLRDKGYVIIFADVEGYNFRPDILAIHPEARKILWLEVKDVPREKVPILEQKKAEYAEKVMDKLGGTVWIIPTGLDILPDFEET